MNMMFGGNPYFGYSPYGFGGFNPYSYDPYGGFAGFSSAFPGMGSGMFGGYQDPYENFFSSFEQKLNDLMAKYEGQMPIDQPVPVTPGAGGAPTGETITTTTETVEAPAAVADTMDFGNLGARLDKGKTIGRKGERKLKKMGYTANQINEAAQMGGMTKSGFQESLQGMTPEGTKFTQ